VLYLCILCFSGRTNLLFFLFYAATGGEVFGGGWGFQRLHGGRWIVIATRKIVFAARVKETRFGTLQSTKCKVSASAFPLVPTLIPSSLSGHGLI